MRPAAAACGFGTSSQRWGATGDTGPRDREIKEREAGWLGAREKKGRAGPTGRKGKAQKKKEKKEEQEKRADRKRKENGPKEWVSARKENQEIKTIFKFYKID